MSSNGLYIILEANIGSGKTSFADALGRAMSAEVLYEPADGDGDLDNPFLKLYYKDGARYSYTMQTHLLSCRYRAHMYAQSAVLYKGGVYIGDRSYFGDQCFAAVQLKLGLFTPDEYKSYMRLHKSMQAGLLYPAVCICLHASPETCAKRIDKRMSEREGRKCEGAIDVEYLRMLQTEIDKLEQDMKDRGVMVISLDWEDDKTPEQIEGAAQRVAAQIRAAVAEREVSPIYCGLAGEGL